MADVRVSADLDALGAAVEGLRWARSRWEAFDRLEGLDRGVLLHDELFRAFGHFAKDWDAKRDKVVAMVDDAAASLEAAVECYRRLEAGIAAATGGTG